MVITKEKLETELGVIKASWVSEFDDLIEFLKDEIKRWIVTLVNNNEDRIASVEQLHSRFKEIGEEIFSLKVKQDITISPIKQYIEECLKKSLAQIVNP
jgi:hypothetical protein